MSNNIFKNRILHVYAFFWLLSIYISQKFGIFILKFLPLNGLYIGFTAFLYLWLFDLKFELRGGRLEQILLRLE